MIFLVSISWISLLHVNTIYGMPDQGTGNATTQELTKDNSTTSNTPFVLRLSPIALNNTNSSDNPLSAPSTSEPPTSKKVDSNASLHDSGSNSRTDHIHHKDHNNSDGLGLNITKKVKQKLKVGDIPFP